MLASIIDDLWIVAQTEEADSDTPELVRRWLAAYQEECVKEGVPIHVGKNIDGVTKAEVQGYVVDGESHTWGASHSRRWQALQAGLDLLLHYRAPPLRMVERLLGKLGFCQGMRPCTWCPAIHLSRYR